MTLRRAFLAAGFAFAVALAQAAAGFVHPGLLHGRDDIARWRLAVAAQEEPIYSGFEKLRADPASQLETPLRGPFEEIGRNPNVRQVEFDADATAAYHCALLWCITGDRAFAEKSKRIVDAWSATLQRVTGADAILMTGLGPFKFINAAELLRHTDTGWTAADSQRTERMLRVVIQPALHDFATFANGNWDTAAIKTLLAIAVFCDDRSLFEHALRYYVAGSGNGRLTHYIINTDGQCQESGRDMGHTQLGLAHLADAAEIAWNQGLDLYAYADHRLLRGFEYAARYNLGENVPFVETLDRTGKYRHTAISARGRGVFRPIYEQVYHHYVQRAGLSAPWTQRAAEKLRPEGESRPIGDHPGFGTLLYTRAATMPASPNAPPAAPAALLATHTTGRSIALTWIASTGAASYTVSRTLSEAPDSVAPIILVRDLKEPRFTDTTAIPGQCYRYTVSASNLHGTSPASAPLIVTAGLPSPWQATDLGAPALAGLTQHDGATFLLEAAGTDLGSDREQFHFVHAPHSGDVVFTARLASPVSSQFSKAGLVIRSTLAPDAARATLLVAPLPSAELERPRWSVQFTVRALDGATRILHTIPIAAPVVRYGRLMQPCWLRLTRRGDTISAAFSEDGTTWIDVGSATLSLAPTAQIGLAACSRLPIQTTAVRFDHVVLQSL